jgi:hypothetical protein
VPRNKDLKRIVRARMKKTGESYTAARANLITKSPRVQIAAPAADLSVLAGIADDRIAEKTGHRWAEWLRLLDAEGARRLEHGEIAALVREKHGVGSWWTQAVAVGYERITGRRDVGQRMDGAYEASKSKTINAPVAVVFDTWADSTKRRRLLDGLDVKVRTSTKPKTMRLQWPDGAIVVLGFEPKSPRKTVVSLIHTKLRDRAALESAKTYWAGRLDVLASSLQR